MRWHLFCQLNERSNPTGCFFRSLEASPLQNEAGTARAWRCLPTQSSGYVAPLREGGSKGGACDRRGGKMLAFAGLTYAFSHRFHFASRFFGLDPPASRRPAGFDYGLCPPLRMTDSSRHGSRIAMAAPLK